MSAGALVPPAALLSASRVEHGAFIDESGASRQQPSRQLDSTTAARYLRLFHTCNNFDFFQGEQYDARQ